jgi:hypothetical protein
MPRPGAAGLADMAFFCRRMLTNQYEEMATNGRSHALPPSAVRRLKYGLALPHGDHEFGWLVERFYALDADLRRAIIERMSTRYRSMKRKR